MQTTQTQPAPLEFVRHPESAFIDENAENATDADTPANPDDPTSRILSTPRRSAWPD